MEVSNILKRRILSAAISVIILLILIAAQAPIAFASAGSPVAVDGRILPAAKTGDSSAWIEVARYNGYSLIMRQTPITSAVTTYSTSEKNNAYASSIARTEINNWYRNKLSSTARLRSYAVKSNAMTNLGSMGVYYVDGISTPTGVAAPTGDDTVFLLSFNEAVLYCSTQYVTESPAQVKPTAYIAYNNYYKLLPKDTKTTAPAYWLRTPGMYYYAAGCVAYSGGTDYDRANGRAYQHTVIGTFGHYRPAIWVGSGIFEEKGTINIRHENVDSGALLNGYTVSVDPGAYGPYGPENFADYDYVGLKPGSDPISGTIAEGETKNIIHQYKKKPDTFTVTYYPNYGTGTINPFPVTAGSVYTVADQGYTRTDYTFNGWNTVPGGGGVSYANGDQITITGNISLYAQWVYKPVPNYYILYLPNGAPGNASLFMAPANTYHTIVDQGYKWDGYIFTGWNTMTNGSGIGYKTGDQILVTDNIYLYAQWEKIPDPNFTVTYYANNGSGASKPYSVVAGTIYTVVDQGFVYTDYTFDSWNTKSDGSGTKYINGSMFVISADVELYAQWTQKINYQTIIYMPNNNSGDAPGIVTTDILGRATISGDRGYTRFNHEFIGWNTEANGSGQDYAPGTQVTLNAMLILYAQWEEIPATYFIYYNAGEGGFGAPVTDGGFLPGVVYTIKGNDYTNFDKPGFYFKYWNTNPNGTGTIVYPNDLYVVTTSDLTLYAIWSNVN